jgi:hypothetical protein
VKDGKQSSTELLAGVTVPALMLMPGIMAKSNQCAIKAGILLWSSLVMNTSQNICLKEGLTKTIPFSRNKLKCRGF